MAVADCQSIKIIWDDQLAILDLVGHNDMEGHD
jgi:hypothetical protein